MIANVKKEENQNTQWAKIIETRSLIAPPPKKKKKGGKTKENKNKTHRQKKPQKNNRTVPCKITVALSVCCLKNARVAPKKYSLVYPA